MARGHRTAKHLDDPLRPFAGLTVGQLLALLAGATAGYGAYKLLAHLPTHNSTITELYIFVVITVAAAVAGPGLLLAGGTGEPFGAQLLGYLRRRHQYAPAQTGSPDVRGQWVQNPRAAVQQRRPGTWFRRTPAQSVQLLPVPAGRPAGGLGGLRIDDDGVVMLPHGELRLYLSIEPLNFACVAPEEQDLLAEMFGALGSLLQPGQRLQVLIESRPLSPDRILAHLRRDLRPDSPVLAEFVDALLPWWERQLVRGHVPDHRFVIVLAPGPSRLKQLGRVTHSPELDLAVARHNLEDSARTIEQKLKRRRMSCRRLAGEEVLGLLWDSLHPGGARCPALASFEQGAASSPWADGTADDADPHRPGPGARQGSARRPRWTPWAARTRGWVVPGAVGLGALLAVALLVPLRRVPAHLAVPVLPGGAVLTLNAPGPGSTSAHLLVTLTDRAGAAIAGALIRLLIDGSERSAHTDARGVASFPFHGTGAYTAQLTATVGGRPIAQRTLQVGARTLVATSPVTGRFYASDNRCTFDTAPTAPPAFTQTFATLNFGGRPFTGYATAAGQADQRAAGVPARGAQVAGLGSLAHFDAVFTGSFAVSRAGDVPFTVLIDDAFNLGIGGGAQRVAGSLSNPPASGVTALARLPIVGAFNQGHLLATTTITVRFPHAGTYAYELDYAECDLGGESLRLSTNGQFLPAM